MAEALKRHQTLPEEPKHVAGLTGLSGARDVEENKGIPLSGPTKTTENAAKKLRGKQLG